MARRLIFRKLTLARFRSFNDPVTINLQKLGSGLHYLRGFNEDNPRLDSNGVGKSSCWDGLLWTCYGRTSAGLKNTDVVPWNGAKNTKGVIEFYIDNKLHWIERYANPNGLLLDGRDVGQSAIDKLLGFSFPVCTHAIIFGQGRALFFDLEPKRKLELFDEVLALDRWLLRSERAGHSLQKRQQIEIRLLADIEANEREQDSLSRMTADLQARAKDWERLRNDKIRSIEERTAACCRRRDILLDERDAADLVLDRAGTELKFLRTDIGKAEDRYNQLNDRLNGYKVKVQVAGREIARIEKILRLAGDCPTCGQPIRRDGGRGYRHHLEQDLDRLDGIQIPKRVLAAVHQARLVVDRLKHARAKYEELEADARTALDRVTPELSSLNAQIKVAEGLLAEHSQEDNPYNRQAADLKKRDNELIRENTLLVQDLAMIRRKIERVRFWVGGFKEVRLYIINEVLAELELATNAVLDSMGLVGWEVRYGIEKETTSGKVSRALHVTILSPANTKAVRWEVWSGGEAQRLKLAGSMALAEVLLNHAGLHTNLEVFDEPSRGMSRVGITDLCDFLSDRSARLDKAIFLTDHHALSTGRFRTTLTVIKDRDGSYLARTG